MKLSEIPYEEINLGLRVIGHSGVHGTVVEKMHLDIRDYGNEGIRIVWDDGKQSQTTIMLCFQVDVLENNGSLAQR